MAKRRRKLRSLVAKEVAPQKPSKRWLNLPLFIAFLFFGIVISIYYSGIKTTMLYSDFLTIYHKHYNLVVHGKDYCKPIIDIEKLFTEINKVVLNQPAALRSVGLMLRNDNRFTAIALAGSTGVGKSLFAQSLKEHFPWQENTQIYDSFGHYADKDSQKKDVLLLLNNLSECGRNLIIIDNLIPEDRDFIQEYNRYALKYVEQSRANLIVMYIFNFLSYSREQREQYDENMKALQVLEDIEIIKFRQFNSSDLKNCIRHEAVSLNLTLDEDDFTEVVRLIEPERSGCKNVRSNVLMNGKPKKK